MSDRSLCRMIGTDESPEYISHGLWSCAMKRRKGRRLENNDIAYCMECGTKTMRFGKNGRMVHTGANETNGMTGKWWQ